LGVASRILGLGEVSTDWLLQCRAKPVRIDIRDPVQAGDDRLYAGGIPEFRRSVNLVLDIDNSKQIIFDGLSVVVAIAAIINLDWQ